MASTRLATVAAAAVLAFAAAPLLRAESDFFCGTGGLANGWQCTIENASVSYWCKHLENQICNPANPWYNNYRMRKDMYRITCTKAGQPSKTCAYCTVQEDGCCWQAGQPEPSCVAPPAPPGEG
jgi:hypothetical protein